MASGTRFDVINLDARNSVGLGLGYPDLTLAAVVKKSFLLESLDSPELSVDSLLIPAGGSQGSSVARLAAKAELCLLKS